MSIDHDPSTPATGSDGPGDRGDRGDPERVAVISLHTSPTAQPGIGDSGGMNVYILAVAKRLAEQGIDVDIFTRRTTPDAPAVQEVGPRRRLFHVAAGPVAPVAKEDLPGLVPEFVGGVVRAAADHADADPGRHAPYDVVHSHYWLSGWVGDRTKRIWGVPHVTTFHTLGRVKNDVQPASDLPEPPARLAGERRVVRGADRILAPTRSEAAELVALYGADPERVRIVPPGVDRMLFVARPRAEALESLRLGGARLVLFVGRLQPFKGPDLAIRAFAECLRVDPPATRDVVMAVVGGPAGASGPGEVERLMGLAAELGVADRVLFFPPQPQERLSDFYSAASLVVVPSRTESFGLVALEAQACGTPVIAADAGGLRQAVLDGRTGFLVRGRDARAYAERMLRVLRDPALAASLSQAAVRHAAGFSWERTATDIRRVYREVLERAAG
jgi:D-inositol-3-phosphate glycosyltransferase